MGDECDCPACEPYCVKTGKKCFVPCAPCLAKGERDDFGEINSQTKRVNRPLAPEDYFG